MFARGRPEHGDQVTPSYAKHPGSGRDCRGVSVVDLCGGQGGVDLNDAAKTENIVALCDVDEARAAINFARFGKQPKYKDYRAMLDKEGNNIDAVTIGIPDFMHATAALACMQLGKHVYCEKPLTRTPWEARLLRDAAAKYRSEEHT